MKCPFCNSLDDRVVESRMIGEGESIRRRRECLMCKARFTSYEKIEDRPLMVKKRNGQPEPFEREKVIKGIFRAIEKRPVSIEKVHEMVDDIEKEIYQKPTREIESRAIGELVMKQLKRVDQVAYVRFASVYQQFEDVQAFISEIKKM